MHICAPKTAARWEKQRKQLRTTLAQLLGDLPPRPLQPTAHLLDKTRRPEGFTVEKLVLDNGAGAVIPAYLCLPEGQHGRSPAILYCHQHGNLYEVGKDEILRTCPAPEMPAAALTRRGFIVLAIDAYGFGERSGKGPGGENEKGAAEELSLSKWNLWLGRSLWAMIVRDDLIALDYLAGRSDVDAARIGVTGFSMGSTRSWWMAALDDRPAAAVCAGCLTRYQDLIASRQLRAHGIYYFVPGILRHFDTEAIVALIAPRPLLTLTGDRDPGSPASGVNTIQDFVKSIYALQGHSGRFRGLVYPAVGHEYTREMWAEMLAWFERWLKQ